MRYHKVFRHLHPRTIQATKALMIGWGELAEHERWERMQPFVKELAAIYNMDPPKVRYNAHCGSGWYVPRFNRIELPKASIVTLLHEFRHAMQQQGKATTFYDSSRDAEDENGGYEIDARAWSLSVYYRVAPRTLTRLVCSGEVMFLTEQDLTGV